MGAVFFYHLTRHPLEVTLPMLLDKSLQAGWRVFVRGIDQSQLTKLDEALWNWGEQAFLPHGVQGGPHDADQPILLGAGQPVNGATCFMSIGGAEISADEVKTSQRACVLFDGNDTSAVELARAQWKTLVDAECSAQYWSEESGNWKKVAER